MIDVFISLNKKVELSEMFQPQDLSAFNFHRSLPNYQETPLYNLEGLANELNLKQILVKDESQRFDLKAFKILGAAWAMAKVLVKYHEFNLDEVTLSSIQSKLVDKEPLTFVTATDGNHGRGVARAARWLGQNAVIYLPHGAAKERLDAATLEGAKAEILPMNYDDAVRYSANMAEKHDWILIQDTALHMYEEIPKDIMNGYETIVHEMKQQIALLPTHVILQAGVGSFAGSFINAFVREFKYLPTIIIVEPKEANCYFVSAKADKGSPQIVTGMLKTIMAGLACGEPNTIAYDLIMRTSHSFISADDEVAKIGIRRLANPLENDPKVIAGESGSVGIGLLEALMKHPRYNSIRKDLGLNSTAKVLCVNTEGDTDSFNYMKILNE